jgi:hypothetical protein
MREILDFHQILLIFLPTLYLKNTKILILNIYEQFSNLIKLNIGKKKLFNY